MLKKESAAATTSETVAATAFIFTIEVMEGVAIAFVFGLIWGSFLNVVIVRFDAWLSTVVRPSATF